MKKSRAVISLIVYVLILGLLGYTAVFGVGSDRSGSASSIKLGLDLAGGVSITYQVVGDENPSSEDMSDTIYKLQQRVQGYSTEAQVYQEGDDRISASRAACTLSHRRTARATRTIPAVSRLTRTAISSRSMCSTRRSTSCLPTAPLSSQVRKWWTHRRGHSRTSRWATWRMW